MLERMMMKLLRWMRKSAYFRFFAGYKMQRKKAFLQTLNISENSLILDVGAATGDLWTEFPPRPKLRIIGLDVDFPAHYCPREAFMAYVIADALSLPFANKSIDALISISVLEHVGDIAAQKPMAQEVLRVSKKLHPNSK
jgi:ubiquinone/menaquinone biosynthesis C-methylase UbiE